MQKQSYISESCCLWSLTCQVIKCSSLLQMWVKVLVKIPRILEMPSFTINLVIYPLIKLFEDGLNFLLEKEILF